MAPSRLAQPGTATPPTSNKGRTPGLRIFAVAAIALVVAAGLGVGGFFAWKYFDEPDANAPPVWQVGNSWTYDRSVDLYEKFGGERDPDVTTMVYTVTDTNDCSGGECRYLADYQNGENDGQVWFDKTTLRPQFSDTTNKANLGIPFPLEVGKEGRFLGSDYTVVTAEEYNVPAGTFFAYRIDFYTEDEDGATETVTWYAPDVKQIIWSQTVGDIDMFGTTYEFFRQEELTEFSV